jgi:L,D-transpeptidase YcbB
MRRHQEFFLKYALLACVMTFGAQREKQSLNYVGGGLMIGFRIPLVAGIAFAVCNLILPAAQAAEPDGPTALISRMDAVYISILEHLNAEGRKALPLDDKDKKALSAYYMNHSQKLLWVNDIGLNDRVAQLQTTFNRAAEWGLNPSDYVPADGKGLTEHSGYAAPWLAEAELKTSIAAYTYAKHAQIGRFDPESLNEYLDKHPERPQAAAVLNGIATAGNDIPSFLESFHPPHEQFMALKKLLAEGEPKEAAPPRVVKLPEGPSLGPGTSHPQVAILRERLGVPVPQDAPDGVTPAEYYDDALADAVRAFQKEHELPAKGIVSSGTRKALNKAEKTGNTVSGRVNRLTIIANMERWRWEPRDLGTRYIRVNIPEFMFHLYDDGKLVHEERIVSGSRDHMTPIFNNAMQYIVFNPYWNVPESILLKEVLPAIRRDPSFLDRNRMEVVWQGQQQTDFFGVDWEGVDPHKLSIRQTPGTGNALGVVKFAFPNKHSVYMHDTPTKHLFSQPVRAFSHGCMRVRNPLKFAEALLAFQGWNSGRIHSILETAHDEQVTLQKQIPIHIQYFTLWVSEDGKLIQYGDVYGHDRRVKVALKLEKATEDDDERKQKTAAEERGMEN